jgi:hypothetical protein
MAAAVYLKTLLVAIATLTAAFIYATPAQAATVEEFEAVCFDEAGEFYGTDACWQAYEEMGGEVDNLTESIARGCVLEDMFEDYSCKGPSAPSPSSSSEAEQGSVTEQEPLQLVTEGSRITDYNERTQEGRVDRGACNPALKRAGARHSPS